MTLMSTPDCSRCDPVVCLIACGRTRLLLRQFALAAACFKYTEIIRASTLACKNMKRDRPHRSPVDFSLIESEKHMTSLSPTAPRGAASLSTMIRQSLQSLMSLSSRMQAISDPVALHETGCYARCILHTICAAIHGFDSRAILVILRLWRTYFPYRP